MQSKLYDITLETLTEDPITRGSDKHLVWGILERLGYVVDGKITRSALMEKECPTFESITRCRRKIQENNPELAAPQTVQHFRKEKEKKKGNFVYHEKVKNKVPLVGHMEMRNGREVFVREIPADIQPSQGK